jgi:hypothetical protein
MRLRQEVQAMLWQNHFSLNRADKSPIDKSDPDSIDCAPDYSAYPLRSKIVEGQTEYLGQSVGARQMNTCAAIRDVAHDAVPALAIMLGYKLRVLPHPSTGSLPLLIHVDTKL